MSTRQGEKYDEPFKREVVSLVVDQKRPNILVCRQYCMDKSTLRRWIANYGPVKTEEGEAITVRAYRELERRLRRSEQENAILKEALVSSVNARNEIPEAGCIDDHRAKWSLAVAVSRRTKPARTSRTLRRPASINSCMAERPCLPPFRIY